MFPALQQLLRFTIDTMTSSIGTSFALVLFSIGMMVSSANAQDSFVPCRRFLHKVECVVVPLATPAEDAWAKQFTRPPSGMAKIYLIRPGTMEPKQKSEIFLDGKWFASLAPMTYLVMEANPGSHTLGYDQQHTSTLKFDVADDQNIYVKEQLYQFFNDKKIVFEILDQQAGQADVLKSTLISAAVPAETALNPTPNP